MDKMAFKPWPCSELKQYPLVGDWTDSFPMRRLSLFRYEHIINATRSLFLTNEFAALNAFFRNYAFQQGAFTNANAMDLEFFYSALSHDYPFFIGDKGVEILSAYKFDENKYQGLEFLRASHFDLFRVEQSTLGMTVLQSMTNPGIQRAFVSLKERPQVGDYLFARLMPVGLFPRFLGCSVVEPWDTVNPHHIDAILANYRRQFEAFGKRYPQTSARAFMKIAGYHVYEAIQARELLEILNARIAPDKVYARTVTYTFEHPESRVRPSDLSGITIVSGEGETPILATVPIAEKHAGPQTLREAILSWNGRDLEVTSFMNDAGDRYLQTVLEPSFQGAHFVRVDHPHDDNETYRSLRHLSLVRRG